MGLWPTKADEGPLADARGSAWDAHCKQSRDRKGALEVWTFNGAGCQGRRYHPRVPARLPASGRVGLPATGPPSRCC